MVVDLARESDFGGPTSGVIARRTRTPIRLRKSIRNRTLDRAARGTELNDSSLNT